MRLSVAVGDRYVPKSVFIPRFFYDLPIVKDRVKYIPYFWLHIEHMGEADDLHPHDQPVYEFEPVYTDFYDKNNSFNLDSTDPKLVSPYDVSNMFNSI